MFRSEPLFGTAVVNHPARLQQVGQEIGVSSWYRIDQDRVDAFAKVTDDADPMHVDPAWCAQHSPFGQTVSFGFLTLSLLTHLSHEVLGWSGSDSIDRDGYGLNYGFDRIRLIEPVPVGSRIRARFTLLDRSEPHPGESRYKYGVTVEIEGKARPALVAEWLALWVNGSAGHARIAGKHKSA